MRLILTGLNHKTATLSLREKIAVRTGGLKAALLSLKEYFDNGLILSTCNRTEIYVVDDRTESIPEKVLAYWKEKSGIDPQNLSKSVYSMQDLDAARHLFKVASGLESMVVGEFEVLGQINQALDTAEEVKMVGPGLRYAFQKAVHAGRKVRTETAISHSALSVSSVAVEMISRLVARISDCSMLIIGTGEAGRLVARVAREKGIARLAIVGRHPERVQKLADELNARPVDSHDVVDELKLADVAVTCSGAPHWALDVQRVSLALEKRPERPLLIIDIAIPRNVEPEVGLVKGVNLYNIDHLKEISCQNRRFREADIHKAELIIEEELLEFGLWWQAQAVKPVLKALINKAEKVRGEQLAIISRKLPSLSEEQYDCLDAMTRAMVNKILHDPICYLKCPGDNQRAGIIKECFNLDV